MDCHIGAPEDTCKCGQKGIHPLKWKTFINLLTLHDLRGKLNAPGSYQWCLTKQLIIETKLSVRWRSLPYCRTGLPSKVGSAWVSIPLVFKSHRRAAVGTRGPWAFGQWESPPEEAILRMIFCYLILLQLWQGVQLKQAEYWRDWQEINCWLAVSSDQGVHAPGTFSEWNICSCKTRILIRIFHHFQSWAS